MNYYVVLRDSGWTSELVAPATIARKLAIALIQNDATHRSLLVRFPRIPLRSRPGTGSFA